MGLEGGKSWLQNAFSGSFSSVPIPQLRRVPPTTAARAPAQPLRMGRRTRRGPYSQREPFLLGMPR